MLGCYKNICKKMILYLHFFYIFKIERSIRIPLIGPLGAVFITWHQDGHQ